MDFKALSCGIVARELKPYIGKTLDYQVFSNLASKFARKEIDNGLRFIVSNEMVKNVDYFKEMADASYELYGEKRSMRPEHDVKNMTDILTDSIHYQLECGIGYEPDTHNTIEYYKNKSHKYYLIFKKLYSEMNYVCWYESLSDCIKGFEKMLHHLEKEYGIDFKDSMDRIICEH